MSELYQTKMHFQLPQTIRLNFRNNEGLIGKISGNNSNFTEYFYRV